MRKTTRCNKRHTLDPFSSLEDLAYTRKYRLQLFGQKVGLGISAQKAEATTLNVGSPVPGKVNGMDLSQTRSPSSEPSSDPRTARRMTPATDQERSEMYSRSCTMSGDLRTTAPTPS